METPRIFPTFPRPRNLEVWETGDADPRIRLALKSLQGLVNKEEPRLYEITAPCDEHWLDYYEKRFGVKHVRIDDPNALRQSSTRSRCTGECARNEKRKCFRACSGYGTRAS